MDEACSRLRLEQESKPEIIWKVERDLLTKQIELSALANDGDDDKSKARLDTVQKEVDSLQFHLTELNEIWKKERDELEKVKLVQEELEEAKRHLKKARRDGDFATAGELQHGEIPNLEKQLQELENDVNYDKGKKKSHKMLAEYVSADAIATCVARHTGIPVSRLTGSESRKLLDMESKLREVRDKGLNQIWFKFLIIPRQFVMLKCCFNITLIINIECCWTRSCPDEYQ